MVCSDETTVDACKKDMLSECLSDSPDEVTVSGMYVADSADKVVPLFEECECSVEFALV